jgi:hypothetical protein
MARSGPTIADTVLALVRERGPQSLDSLVPEVVAAGRTKARDPRRAVQAAIDAHPAFVQAWDGRWCSLVDQLEGAIFTARLTRLERQDGIVIMGDDLALVQRLALRPIPFARGDEVHLDYFGDFYELPWPDDDLEGIAMRDELGPETADDLLDLLAEAGLPPDQDDDEVLRDLAWEMRFTRILHGPPGWLPPLGPKQLLGITVRAGALDTMALDRRDVGGPHVGLAAARVARLAQMAIGPDPSWFGPPVISLEELLELVATEAPEILRRPLPPFRDVVRRAGLETRDGFVAHRGMNWDAWGRSAALATGELWGFQPSRIVH